MKINPGATMFLLSAVAIGKNAVTGFTSPVSRRAFHSTTFLAMNGKQQPKQQGEQCYNSIFFNLN